VQKVVLNCGTYVLCTINECRTEIFVHFTGHDVWAVMERVKNILLMWQKVQMGVSFGK